MVVVGGGWVVGPWLVWYQTVAFSRDLSGRRLRRLQCRIGSRVPRIIKWTLKEDVEPGGAGKTVSSDCSASLRSILLLLGEPFLEEFIESCMKQAMGACHEANHE